MTFEEYKIMEEAHRKMWSDLALTGKDHKPNIMEGINYKCTACQVAINTLGRQEGRCVCCPVTEWRLRAIANPHRYYDNTPCTAKDAGGADIFYQWEHCWYIEVRKELAAQIRDMEWSYIDAYDTAQLDPHAIQSMSVYLGITTPYIDRHKASGIKVGDWIKITRKCIDHEEGWGNAWTTNMDKFVGKTYQVDDDWNESGFQVVDPDQGAHRFPFFVLEKVEQELPEGIQKAVNAMNSQLCNENFIRYTEEIVKYIDERTKDY